MAVWELRQSQKSGWHYVGHTVAATGETHCLPHTETAREGGNGWFWNRKRGTTEVKSRSQRLWERLRKRQGKIVSVNLFLRALLTRCPDPVSSFVPCSPCCVPSISLTSVPPSPAWCANIFFYLLFAARGTQSGGWWLPLRGGLMCTAPSPPLTTTSTSVRGGQHNTDGILREESSLWLPI